MLNEERVKFWPQVNVVFALLYSYQQPPKSLSVIIDFIIIELVVIVSLLEGSVMFTVGPVLFIKKVLFGANELLAAPSEAKTVQF